MTEHDPIDSPTVRHDPNDPALWGGQRVHPGSYPPPPGPPSQQVPAQQAPPQGAPLGPTPPPPPPGGPGPGPQGAGPWTGQQPYQAGPHGPQNAYAAPQHRGAGRPSPLSGPAGIAALLAIVALAGVAIGIFVKEDGRRLWDNSEAWSVFALVCALLVFVPVFGASLNLTPERAWTVGAIGAAGLILYWVLLVLPSISQNTSFAVTVGVAAAAGAVWLAPGKRL